MANHLSDERDLGGDLGSGIVLHYRSLQNINNKSKSVAQSNSRSLNLKQMAKINLACVLCVVYWYSDSI